MPCAAPASVCPSCGNICRHMGSVRLVDEGAHSFFHRTSPCRPGSHPFLHALRWPLLAPGAVLAGCATTTPHPPPPDAAGRDDHCRARGWPRQWKWALPAGAPTRIPTTPVALLLAPNGPCAQAAPLPNSPGDRPDWASGDATPDTPLVAGHALAQTRQAVDTARALGLVQRAGQHSTPPSTRPCIPWPGCWRPTAATTPPWRTSSTARRSNLARHPTPQRPARNAWKPCAIEPQPEHPPSARRISVRTSGGQTTPPRPAPDHLPAMDSSAPRAAPPPASWWWTTTPTCCDCCRCA